MTKTKLQEGDIFYVKHKGKYVFGKVLLDVSNRILKSEEDNLLKTFSGCYMVGVFKGLYDDPVLTSQDYIIPSAYTYKKFFYSKDYRIDWTFYKSEEINYKQIDFPESLISVHREGVCFSKGELQLKTNLSEEEYENDYRILKTVQPSYYIIVDYACYYQGREDLMNLKVKNFLDSSDLRFSPEKRNAIYLQLGESSDQSYYDLALKHGLDLARFYN